MRFKVAAMRVERTWLSALLICGCAANEAPANVVDAAPAQSGDGIAHTDAAIPTATASSEASTSAAASSAASPSPNDACEQLATLCHDVGHSGGEPARCHELGHARDEAACTKDLVDCKRTCEAAAKKASGQHGH